MEPSVSLGNSEFKSFLSASLTPRKEHWLCEGRWPPASLDACCQASGPNEPLRGNIRRGRMMSLIGALVPGVGRHKQQQGWCL